ncbi:MAG: hypothetical protein LBJ77_00415 [Holosporales bacterium]|jgi:hypothetical protein|nr:hypothetical protein [Holosporales bacterium]
MKKSVSITGTCRIPSKMVIISTLIGIVAATLQKAECADRLTPRQKSTLTGILADTYPTVEFVSRLPPPDSTPDIRREVHASYGSSTDLRKIQNLLLLTVLAPDLLFHVIRALTTATGEQCNPIAVLDFILKQENSLYDKAVQFETDPTIQQQLTNLRTLSTMRTFDIAQRMLMANNVFYYRAQLRPPPSSPTTEPSSSSTPDRQAPIQMMLDLTGPVTPGPDPQTATAKGPWPHGLTDEQVRQEVLSIFGGAQLVPNTLFLLLIIVQPYWIRRVAWRMDKDRINQATIKGRIPAPITQPEVIQYAQEHSVEHWTEAHKDRRKIPNHQVTVVADIAQVPGINTVNEGVEAWKKTPIQRLLDHRPTIRA